MLDNIMIAAFTLFSGCFVIVFAYRIGRLMESIAILVSSEGTATFIGRTTFFGLTGAVLFYVATNFIGNL